MKYHLIILVLILLIQGCFIQQPERIIIENDIVKLRTLVKRDFFYKRAIEQKSPLINMRQTVFKSINNDASVQYNVLDKISLRYSSYDLDTVLYIILNGNIILPIKITNFDKEIRLKISENTDEILTSDSIKVNLVTGYSYYRWNTYRVEYSLTNEDVLKILNSESIQFRYYAGHNMITLRLSDYKLSRLKKLFLMI